ncbi:MAG: Gfo/Idh/MocA family oxidoreductase [bacterium]|nr:MAG: Gfo/Idh/MocA family oxidoreductase [bacterium]
MRLAIVGCGNIAPFYVNTLPLHPRLELVGGTDLDEDRARKFSQYYSIRHYRSLDEILADGSIDLVLNLTNPKSHYAVSRACLEAGKHVYSEKPLAMSFAEAEELVTLAEESGLQISSAPSRILGETAQTMWKALRDDAIGTVHLVYAEMDGGLLHQMPYKQWSNEVGVPWPYKDEMEVGCTLEHAAYSIGWLMAFFGPVDTVTAFSHCQIPDKMVDVPLEADPPDFSVALMKFRSGVLARLTCSWIAPHDKSLRIFGDRGNLCTDDISTPCAPVYSERTIRFLGKAVIRAWKKKFPLVRPPRLPLSNRLALLTVGPPGSFIKSKLRHLRKRVDFCLGIAELEAAIREGRPSRLSAGYCLHHTEVALAIHNALETGGEYRVKTSFEPMDPMPWAMP